MSVESKMIVLHARKVLEELYSMIGEKELLVEFKISELAPNVSITENQVRRALNYLKALGVIEISGKPLPNINTDDYMIFRIHPVTIEQLENNRLFK